MNMLYGEKCREVSARIWDIRYEAINSGLPDDCSLVKQLSVAIEAINAIVANESKKEFK